MRLVPLLLALSVTAVPALAACDGDEPATTAISIVPSGEIGIELGASIVLPDDFPAEVPLPAGVELEGADSLTGETAQIFDITGWYDGDPVEAADAYLSELEAAGFEVTSSTETDRNVFFVANGDTWFVSAGFFPDPVRNVGTSVGVTVGPVSSAPAGG